MPERIVLVLCLTVQGGSPVAISRLGQSRHGRTRHKNDNRMGNSNVWEMQPDEPPPAPDGNGRGACGAWCGGLVNDRTSRRQDLPDIHDASTAV